MPKPAQHHVPNPFEPGIHKRSQKGGCFRVRSAVQTQIPAAGVSLLSATYQRSGASSVNTHDPDCGRLPSFAGILSLKSRSSFLYLHKIHNILPRRYFPHGFGLHHFDESNKHFILYSKLFELWSINFHSILSNQKQSQTQTVSRNS
jgi:hypothetical protein